MKDKNRWLFRLSFLIVIALTLVIGASALAFASNLSEQIELNEQQLGNIKNEINNIDKSRLAIEKAQTTIEREINALEKDIRERDSKIASLNKQISETQQSILKKETELQGAKKEVVFQNERMLKRLRTMYKSGNLGYVEVLLGASNFSDLMTRSDKVQLLLDYDKEMLTKLKTAKDFIANAKIELETKRSLLLGYKGDVEKERTELKVSTNLNENKKDELAQNHKALLNLLRELKEDADKLTNMIKQQKLREKYIGGVLMWPVPLDYTSISSPFGNRRHPILGQMIMHTGIDIPAPRGTNVFAVGDGQVLYADWMGSYGKMVMIDHGGGIVTVYAHNSGIEVSAGQNVKRGDTIAKIGSTGRSTGNHLHFEVREKGNYINPLTKLKK